MPRFLDFTAGLFERALTGWVAGSGRTQVRDAGFFTLERCFYATNAVQAGSFNKNCCENSLDLCIGHGDRRSIRVI